MLEQDLSESAKGSLCIAQIQMEICLKRVKGTKLLEQLFRELLADRPIDPSTLDRFVRKAFLAALSRMLCSFIFVVFFGYNGYV